MNSVVVNIQRLQVDQMAPSRSNKSNKPEQYHLVLLLKENETDTDSSLTRINTSYFLRAKPKQKAV